MQVTDLLAPLNTDSLAESLCGQSELTAFVRLKNFEDYLKETFNLFGRGAYKYKLIFISL